MAGGGAWGGAIAVRSPTRLGPHQVLGNLLSDAVDPHSWRTKKVLCEEDEAEAEAEPSGAPPKRALLIYHLLAHLESPMWPTQARPAQWWWR